MASFKIYTYQFTPLVGDVSEVEETLFNDSVLTAESVMANKQASLQSLFDNESTFTFLVGNQLFRHQVLLNYNGIILLRIANNKKLRQEEDFCVHELVNQPSCKVIIDNRGGCQTIAIQNLPSAFANPDQVARIMQQSFNVSLKRSGLAIDIRARIEETSFWRIIDSHPDGIKSIQFDIPYPNLPRVSDNVDALLKEVCRELEANTRFEINALQGQTLKLEKTSKLLEGLVKVSSISGHPIKLLPFGPKPRWISTGTGSAVWSEIKDDDLSCDGSLFDDNYEKIAEKMNGYK